jgi:uncharacterized metal-binding protein
MAPNLALSKHVLIQDVISSKLQVDKVLKDDDIAKIAECSDRTEYPKCAIFCIYLERIVAEVSSIQILVQQYILTWLVGETLPSSTM